jgi:hypothetical protein
MLVSTKDSIAQPTKERIRTVMDSLHRIRFFSKDARVLQSTDPTPEQVNIFKLPKIHPHERIQSIQNTPEIHRHTTEKTGMI